MLPITFSFQEFRHAAIGGLIRRIDGIERAAKGRYGFAFTTYESWGVDIEAALAEAAVARWANEYWSTGKLGGADVGRNIQVRSTLWSTGKLILHPGDPDDAPFVLVVNRGIRQLLIGWIFGKAGKQKRWWGTLKRQDEPAFLVPQEALTPINEEGTAPCGDLEKSFLGLL